LKYQFKGNKYINRQVEFCKNMMLKLVKVEEEIYHLLV
jgi:hypothetical protein